MDDAAICVVKEAGDYDPVTHTVAYKVTVEENGSGVQGLVLKDLITTQNGELLPESLVARIGETEQETPLCALLEDGSYEITNLPDLMPGQILTLEYLVHVNDEVPVYQQPKGTIGLANLIEAAGKTPQGLIMEDSDQAWKSITVNNLTKAGYRTTKDNQSVIQWTATIGDGSYDVGGIELEDVLGDYLSLYQDSPITIEAVTASGSVTSKSVAWTDGSVLLSEDESGFRLTLPESTTSNPYTIFRVRYYTTYQEQESFTVYYNTVSATLHGTQMGATGNCSIAPISNITMVKTGERNGEYLDWTIKVEIPAGLYGTRGFYLTDYCDGVVLLENGKLAYRSAQLSNAQYTITAVTKSGETIQFNRYKNNGITENTYSIAWENDYSDASTGKYNNIRAILFNCTGLATWDSTWMLNEACTLTVLIRVPIDNGVSYGYTAREVLDGGGFMNNIATFFAAENQKARSTAVINGVPLHKSGAQSEEDGILDYAVTLRNHDHVSESAVMTAQMTQSMEFIDIFDERLAYQIGSLQVELKTYETSGSVGNTVAIFYYAGEARADGLLQVSADEFIDASGQSLREYAASQKGTTWYNFFFTYQLKVKEAYRNAITTYMEFENTASLRWGPEKKDVLSAEASAVYQTGLLTKTTVNAPEEGALLGNSNILQYQIELNPRKLDMDPNSDILTVRDILPDCLNVLWDDETQANVIGEYWDEEAGAWRLLEEADGLVWKKSYYYDKQLGQNVLQCQVPDECYVRITYRCQVTEYGEAVSIVNQRLICKGWFLPPNTYDCGSLVEK